jgi:hypothetical protein
VSALDQRSPVPEDQAEEGDRRKKRPFGSDKPPSVKLPSEELVQAERLRVIGAEYELETGRVRFLEHEEPD